MNEDELFALLMAQEIPAEDSDPVSPVEVVAGTLAGAGLVGAAGALLTGAGGALSRARVGGPAGAVTKAAGALLRAGGRALRREVDDVVETGAERRRPPPARGASDFLTEAETGAGRLRPPPARGASDFLTEAETGLARITPEGARIQQNLDAVRAAAEWDRTPVTHKATIREARRAVEEIGLDPTKLSDSKLSPAGVLGLAQRVQQNTDELATLSNALVRGTKDDGSPFTLDELSAMQQRVDDLTEMVNNDAAQLGAEGTKAGRQLNIFRLLARRGKPQDNAGAWILQAKKVKGAALTDTELADLTRLINSGDVGELQYQISRLAPRGGLAGRTEQAVSLFRSLLLTNPAPHIANVLGNTATAGFREVSDILAVGLDRLIAKVVPNAVGVTKANPLMRYGAQARASWKAAKEARFILGLSKESLKPLKKGDGARAALRAWAERIRRSGFSEDELQKLDFRRVHFDNPAADVLSKLSFVGMEASDRIFRAPAYAGSLADQAATIAAREGLRGKALRKRVAQLMKNPTEEMVLQAAIDAERAVFMERGELAKRFGKFRDLFGPVGGFLIPFTTFPSNLAQRLITELSPIGTMRGAAKIARIAMGSVPEELISQEQRRAVELLANSTLASGGPFLLGYMLSQMGLMTGPGMTPERRARYDTLGGKPNSIKVGDTWYRIDRLTPIASLMMMGATFHEAQQVEELEGTDKLLAVLGSAAAVPLESSPVQGVRDIVEAFSPKYAGARGTTLGRIGSNIVGSIVTPPLIARAAAAADDRERVADTFSERIQARIPLLREKLPERIDVLGTPVPSRGGLSAFGVFSPSADRTIGDPVRAELARLNVGLRPPQRKKDETGQDYQFRAELYGRQAERDLLRVMLSEEYAFASDDRKKDMLRAALSSSRSRLTRALNAR